MQDNKKIIWDLFGGGCNSVANMLIKNELIRNYIVYTFDVVPLKNGQLNHPNHHYIEIDLACGMNINNKKHKVKNRTKIVNLFEDLNLPNPDIIVASPLCQSFSSVLSLIGGGTCFWKKENPKDLNTLLIERSLEEFEKLKSGFTRNFKADRQLFIKRLGQQCIDNTIALIRHYKPKYWYIENPATSLMWYYIKNNLKFKGYSNYCSYGAYGYKITKLTCFYSNVKIDFMTHRIKPPYKKEYEEISSAEYKKIINSSKHKTAAIRNGKFYKIWYRLDNGKKTWCPKDAGLGQMQVKHSFKYKQESGMTTKQLNEATMASSIPSDALYVIFKEFK